MLIQITDDYWVNPEGVASVVADGDTACRICHKGSGHRDVERPAAEVVDLINRATTRIVEIPKDPAVPVEDLGQVVEALTPRRTRPPGGGW